MTAIDVTAADGQVLDVQRWSTTHVETSGGGGSIHNGEGYIRDVTTTSSSVSHCKAFIKLSDGSEIDVDVGDSLGLRQGSRVRLVYTQPRGGRRLMVCLVNLDLKEQAYFDLGVAVSEAIPRHTFKDIWKPEGFAVGFGVYVVLWIAAAVLSFFTLLLSFFVMLFYSIWLNGVIQRRTKAFKLLETTRAARLYTAIDAVRDSGAPVTVTIGD